MATTVHSWMPAHGRHRVNVGTSLGRALKARKGTAATKRSNLPDRDFYSFRYNFKPPSIDSTKPGTIDVKRGKDSTGVSVEHSSSQAGEGHAFVGLEQLAKGTDCVLIYDEETGTFTLEKLDSYMVLTYERKTTTNDSHSQGSALPAQPTSLSLSQESSRDLDLEAQLERDLLGMEEDADGEPDEEFEQIIPFDTTTLRQEEEEEDEDEEDEEDAIPLRELSKQRPKPSRTTKPETTPEERAIPSAAKSKPPGIPKGKAKRESAAVTSDVEEEDLEFGQPARKTKRVRPTPPAEGLALPGSSSAVRAPSASHLLPFASSHRSGNSASLPPASAVSDSEEEWEPVPPSQPGADAASGVMNTDDDDGEGDEEEIDMSAFEAEMNMHLESDDFLAEAASPDPDAIAPTNVPMSLNQFAREIADASQDEDDYSSSEESDED